MIDALLAGMTVDEKVAQLGCVWVTDLLVDGQFDEERAAEKIPEGIGHITRIGASTALLPEESAALMNRIQRFAVERTRLGIPVIVHEESTGGYCARGATVFPQALALAATWDPDLVTEVADTIRRQMVSVGARQALAPVLDIGRDPRWGRVEETYGEDPYLAGAIGVAYVKGLQRETPVAATGKHFLGYGLPEGGRNHGPAHIGPRELREVYAEPFAAAIRHAQLASVMNSYGSVDGLPCAGSHEILTTLLRDELGFDGVVVADYFSVALLVAHHHVAADRQAAAAIALHAGLDMELPATDCYGTPLVTAIAEGQVDMATLDRAVRRVLAIKERLGLFEHPYTETVPDFDTARDRALAKRAAARAAVLLTNEHNLLPLDPTARIAVYGPAADDKRLLQGDYHYPAHVEILNADNPLLPNAGQPGAHFTRHITPLEGIRAYAPHATFSRGCDLQGDELDAIDTAAADVAVVIVGGRSGLTPECTVGEARDATDLDLTGRQPDLIAAVAASGIPTVVVVLSGRVHTIADAVDRVGAVLATFPSGEEGGAALADILFGTVAPSGRLPVTIPRRVGQVPVHSGARRGGRRSEFWGDYTDSPSAPLFSFGHGLSYTTFEYRDLTATPARIEVTVTNTGGRDGEDVVQLYVTDIVASVARPERLLVGFTRVALTPGESRRVGFQVHPSRLAFYDEAMRFVVEEGMMTAHVGPLRADFHVDAWEGRQRDIVETTCD